MHNTLIIAICSPFDIHLQPMLEDVHIFRLHRIILIGYNIFYGRPQYPVVTQLQLTTMKEVI